MDINVIINCVIILLFKPNVDGSWQIYQYDSIDKVVTPVPWEYAENLNGTHEQRLPSHID